MAKKLVVLVLAIFAGACAVRTVRLPDGSLVQQRTAMSQVGVQVSFLNQCAPIVDLEDGNGPVFFGVRYGETVVVPISSTAFSGYNRNVFLRAKAHGRDRSELLGSSTKEFYVNIHYGSRSEEWTLDRLDRPTPGGGCKPPGR